MGASENLSTKSEGKETAKIPALASVYTSVAYLLTVLLLILPYLVRDNDYVSLGCTAVVAVPTSIELARRVSWASATGRTGGGASRSEVAEAGARKG